MVGETGISYWRKLRVSSILWREGHYCALIDGSATVKLKPLGRSAAWGDPRLPRCSFRDFSETDPILSNLRAMPYDV